MTFRDILVHVDDATENATRLESAINLAKTTNARLTGLFVRSRPYIPPYAEVQISPEILQRHAEEIEELAKQAEKNFRATVKGSGVKAEWRSVEGGLGSVLSLHARYHDLVVLGQKDPRDLLMPGDRDMPDEVIMTCGRPSLIIPYAGKFPTIGRNVMVAWDASATATRAVHDALPILKTAKAVTVMVINPMTDLPGIGDLPGADIAAHLARHGVKAEADHVESDLDAGEMLLSRAADKGADLLVMGAYGHARWREVILGGVTDHLLDHMTLPVLMSH
ncbi:MAG TPA: universal stress protein [Rhodospirillales bacterium]